MAASWVLGPVHWPAGGALLVLLAGAVGYGTNFLAVQMLFKPRRPQDWIPMRWIWRQGLVPARQGMLAAVVGEEVASRLLTPEAIADELTRLARRALEDPDLNGRLRDAAQEILAREVPGLVRRVHPEVVGAFERFLAGEVSTEEFRRALERVAGDWLGDPANREELADLVLAFFRRETGLIIDLVKKALKKYRKKGAFRSFGIGLSRATSILDWEDFESSLARLLQKPKTREWALHLVDRFRLRLGRVFDRLFQGRWVDEVKNRAGVYVLEGTGALVEREVVPALVRFAGSEAFGRYLAEEAIPRARPAILEWVREGRFDPFFASFDVRGRVAGAAAGLAVAELEEMANRVAAYHLGAIQVLGYVLGILAGFLTYLVDRVGAL